MNSPFLLSVISVPSGFSGEIIENYDHFDPCHNSKKYGTNIISCRNDSKKKIELKRALLSLTIHQC